MSFWKTVGVLSGGAVAAVTAVVLLPVEAAAAAVGVTVLGVGAIAAAMQDGDDSERTETAMGANAKSAEEARRARDAMDEALNQLTPYKQREGLRLAILGALVGALCDADALNDGTFAGARSFCFGEFSDDDPVGLIQSQDKILASPPGLVDAATQLARFPSAPWTAIGDVMRAMFDSAAVGHFKFATVLAAWDQASRPFRPNQEIAVARA